MKLYSLKDINEGITTFTKNALEGAVLSGLVTLGPHIFQKYASPTLEPTMGIQAAIAANLVGTLGYATYKTVIHPVYVKTDKTLSEIPKKTSNFLLSALGRSDSQKDEKKSIFSLSLWSIGTLSAFGYLNYQLSEMTTPWVATSASAFLAFGGSYMLNNAAVKLGRDIHDLSKDSKAFKTTCEIIENLYKSVGSVWKAATIGAGMFAAVKVKETFIDPPLTAVNPHTYAGDPFVIKYIKPTWEFSMTISSQSLSLASTVVDYALAGVTNTVNALHSGATVISGWVFRKETLENCEKQIHSPDSWLCQGAGKIDSFFTNYANPTIDATSSFLNSAKDGFYNLGASIAGGLVGAGFFVSGILQTSKTVENCHAQDAIFLENNPALCASAENIDAFMQNYIKPAGKSITKGAWNAWSVISGAGSSVGGMFVTGFGIASGLVFRKETLEKCTDQDFLTNNEFLCSNAGRIDAFVENVINPSWNTLSEGASHFKNMTVALVQNPMAQKIALGAAGLAAGVYLVHHVSTKVSNYWNERTQTLPVVNPDVEVAVPGDVNTNPIPSAPPIELMKEEPILALEEPAQNAASDKMAIESSTIADPQPIVEEQVDNLSNNPVVIPARSEDTVEELKPSLDLNPEVKNVTSSERKISAFLSKAMIKAQSFFAECGRVISSMYNSLVVWVNNLWESRARAK